MNTISWMIYGFEVILNLAEIFKGLTFFFLVGCVLTIIASTLAIADGGWDEDAETKFVKYRKLAIKLLIIPLVLVFVGAFIPSKSTLYMIAGSEIAEAGYTSEMGGKVGQLVEQKINELLVEETKK